MLGTSNGEIRKMLHCINVMLQEPETDNRNNRTLT